MCRIVGIWEFTSKGSGINSRIIQMRDTLSHGGPDDAGTFVDSKAGVALGHRRLSILDLSEKGKQPMEFESLVITYNGEVYNYRDIKKELEACGYTFDSNTDTEVVLKAFHKWGKEAVHRFRGMFAFALWNKERKELLLCRDRVGVKPLFWYYKNGVFMFASELKAFFEYEDFALDIDRKAVAQLLQYGYITASKSIFSHVKKVKPGHFLTVSSSGEIKEEKYWDVYEYLNTDKEEHSVEELEERLKESFKLRMVSDVPVGVFLSGGIDSSLVSAIVQSESSKPIKTFTIGFEDKEYDEAKWAKLIAKHIGTEHHELYCTEKELFEIVPKLSYIYDEPFGDSSGIPTYLVSQLARQSVKVVLSGDGGDEIFGGYVKYMITQNVFGKLKVIHPLLRRAIKGTVELLGRERFAELVSRVPYLKSRYKNLKTKVHKFINVFDAKDEIEFFVKAGQFVSDKEIIKLVNINLEDIADYHTFHGSVPENKLISLLGAIDIKTYLPDDILVKVDRASMSIALEAREPFLDQNLISFGLSLPGSLKVKDGKGKYLLREVLYKYVPREIVDRPKQGFGIPVEKWLRGALREYLLDMLGDRLFTDSMDLNYKVYRRFVNGFLESDGNVSPHFVWNLYSLWLWYKRWIQKEV